MDIVFDNKFYKVQYLFYFIARSFLIAIICFMCFISILFTLYFIDAFFSSKKPLFSAYIIASPSMVPTIKINDAIIVRRIDRDQYNIGDIITFESSYSQYKGLMVTHRIVDKKTNSIFIPGASGKEQGNTSYVNRYNAKDLLNKDKINATLKIKVDDNNYLKSSINKKSSVAYLTVHNNYLYIGNFSKRKSIIK